MAVSAGCTEPIFTDGEPVVRTAPPEPRNQCEETFASRLTDDLGTAEASPPTPSPDALLAVMDACSGAELLEADDYFSFDSGPPNGRLNTRRLFNGPGRDAQLVTLCGLPQWSATHACETP